MDRRTLEKLLEKNAPNLALERLKSVLDIPASFEELAEELPPEIRRLGPGAWLAAIRPVEKKLP